MKKKKYLTCISIKFKKKNKMMAYNGIPREYQYQFVRST